MKINKKLIKELVSCLEDNKLTELEYSEKDVKIKVARDSFKDTNSIQMVQNIKKVKLTDLCLNILNLNILRKIIFTLETMKFPTI